MELNIKAVQYGFGLASYWTAVIRDKDGKVLSSSAGHTMREAIDNALNLIS